MLIYLLYKFKKKKIHTSYGDKLILDKYYGRGKNNNRENNQTKRRGWKNLFLPLKTSTVMTANK